MIDIEEVSLEKTLQNIHEICKITLMDESKLRRRVIDIYNETHPDSKVDYHSEDY